jgi:hypothetical protein
LASDRFESRVDRGIKRLLAAAGTHPRRDIIKVQRLPPKANSGAHHLRLHEPITKFTPIAFCHTGIVTLLTILPSSWHNAHRDVPSPTTPTSGEAADMTPPGDPARDKHHRFPGEIISHGVRLYDRFPLSYRDVQERLGSVLDVEMTMWDKQPTGIPIDEYANDDVVHLDRLREADRLTDQAFDPRASRQMLALDFLGVPCARTRHVGCEMSCIRPPMIRIKPGELEGL